MTMEIILREDVQHLGKAGAVVRVKDGYARNYLLPQGLAYPATEANKKKITFEAERIAKQRAAEKAAAEGDAGQIAAVQLTFPVKVGEEDKLYGSVTAGGIQRKQEGRGIHAEERQVDPPQPRPAPRGVPLGVKVRPPPRPRSTRAGVRE